MSGRSAEATIAELVHAVICGWVHPPPEYSFEEMCRRCRGLEEFDLDGSVIPRLEQLDFYVREGALLASNCTRTVIEQPRALSSYTVQMLWEYEGFVAVNKPFDMRIDLPKGKPRHWPGERNVADWFIARYPDAPVRFCHQLDFATSGVLLMASTKKAARQGGIALGKRRARKTYLALVLGHPPWDEEAHLCHRLTSAADNSRSVAKEGEPGEDSETIVRVLWRGHWPNHLPHVRFPGGERQETPAGVEAAADSPEDEAVYWPARAPVEAALVECRPVTGRQHQIRLHLTAAGFPILGDRTYGSQPWGDGSGSYRMFLHALRIELPIPNLGVIKAEAPCEFLDELVDFDRSLLLGSGQCCDLEE